MKTIHIVPHSHWDREWYMLFEKHRYRLVRLFDTLIPLMEQRPEYRYFHLDGQTIMVDDYLAIRPEMADRLTALIQADRIQIGPWYILQDEYLTSGEANIRNMQEGLRRCRELGASPVMTGYFPDSFGNIAQAPQIVRGFGIDTAVFGRGITRMAADNVIVGQSDLVKSEIEWRSPDGSSVLGIMFSNWYNNASELPVEAEEAAARAERLLHSCETFALTDDLLGMNGCDHQPVQVDLPEALVAMNRALKGRAVCVHSSIKEYLEAVKADRPAVAALTGEIAGQLTDGHNLLIGTASSRIYLKQRNHDVQNLLETEAEPAAAMAFAAGMPYESNMLRYAWKRLMQNHPHDSICGCSVDEVHAEMMTRFAKAEQAAECVRDTARQRLADSVAADPALGIPLVVFPKGVHSRAGVVKVSIDLPGDCGFEAVSVFTAEGVELPSVCRCVPHHFTYTLPDDKFRQVRYTTRFEVEFLLTSSGGMGYTTVYVRPGACFLPAVPAGERDADNGRISFTIQEDGTLSVTHRASGVTRDNWLVWEDTGDIGNEYDFRPSEDGAAVTSAGRHAEVERVETNALRAVFRITQTLPVPPGRDGSRRADGVVPLTLSTLVTLYRGAELVEFDTVIDNAAKDHRLRALFPTGLHTDRTYAQGQFHIAERAIEPWKGWTNPGNPQRMEAFVEMHDDKVGFLVAGQGLNEYEALRDEARTLALTVLRCVGELGDWGVFPTPDAQCLGKNRARFAVGIFPAGGRFAAMQNGLAFSRGKWAALQTEGSGNAAAEKFFACCGSEAVAYSAFLKAEGSDSLLLRVYNLSNEPETAELSVPPQVRAAEQVRLDETPVGGLTLKAQTLTITLKPHEIVTVRLEVDHEKA